MMPAKNFRVTPNENKTVEISMENEFVFSNQDDLNLNYLNNSVDNVIGTPKNFEKTDYNFENSSLTFELYFFKDITDNSLDNLKNFINIGSGSDWDTYYTKLTKQLSDENHGKKSTDFNGTPSYFNSFGYLYDDPNNLYKGVFTNQAFFYYSFIKIDFFTSTDIYRRKKIFTKLVYNNPRYMAQENGVTEAQPMPKYILDQETDGFVVNWLSETPVTDLYATFTYFDSFPVPGATKPRTISLIPSKPDLNNKNKWVLSTKNLQPQEYYVNYKLNPASRTYSIQLYNPIDGKFSIASNKIDFYEMKISEYWAKFNGYVKTSRNINSTLIVEDLADNFALTTDYIKVYNKYQPTQDDYFKQTSMIIGGVETLITAKDQQTITNTGKSDLMLNDITLEIITGKKTKGRLNGYSANLDFSEYTVDDNLNQSMWYTKSEFLFFNSYSHDRQVNPYLKSTYPLYYDSFFNSKCNSMTVETIHDPIVKREMPIRLDIVYKHAFNTPIKPGKSVSIDINTIIGGTFVRGSMPNAFKNFLVFNEFLVTIYMKDSVSGEIISKSFIIDFKLLVLRNSNKDWDTTFTSDKIHMDGGKSYYYRICNDKLYFDGTYYTVNILPGELFSEIGETYIKPVDLVCKTTPPVAVTYEDYVNSQPDQFGNQEYLRSYDDLGNEIIVYNQNYIRE